MTTVISYATLQRCPRVSESLRSATSKMIHILSGNFIRSQNSSETTQSTFNLDRINVHSTRRTLGNTQFSDGNTFPPQRINNNTFRVSRRAAVIQRVKKTKTMTKHVLGDRIVLSHAFFIRPIEIRTDSDVFTS